MVARIHSKIITLIELLSLYSFVNGEEMRLPSKWGNKGYKYSVRFICREASQWKVTFFHVLCWIGNISRVCKYLESSTCCRKWWCVQDIKIWIYSVTPLKVLLFSGAIMVLAGKSPNSWWRHQMETFSALLAYWPFVWGIHRSPVNSHHKGQWRGALMFYLIC